MAARVIAAFVALATCGLLLKGCDSSQQKTVAVPPLPVGVVTVERRDVPLFVELVGTTRGTQDVPIRARVEGFLETMDFREGSFVKKGDLLYTIDSNPVCEHGRRKSAAGYESIVADCRPGGEQSSQRPLTARLRVRRVSFQTCNGLGLIDGWCADICSNTPHILET